MPNGACQIRLYLQRFLVSNEAVGEMSCKRFSY